jgi:hypothetical protein
VKVFRSMYMIRPELGHEELGIHKIFVDRKQKRDFTASEIYLFHARCMGTNHPIIEGLQSTFERRNNSTNQF